MHLLTYDHLSNVQLTLSRWDSREALFQNRQFLSTNNVNKVRNETKDKSSVARRPSGLHGRVVVLLSVLDGGSPLTPLLVALHLTQSVRLYIVILFAFVHALILLRNFHLPCSESLHLCFFIDIRVRNNHKNIKIIVSRMENQEEVTGICYELCFNVDKSSRATYILRDGQKYTCVGTRSTCGKQPPW